jgi:LSD1 subclass zinc finger protein
LSIKKAILKPFNVLIKNIKDRNNIYRRCHKCKTILKLPLPYDRGIKHAKCPNCGKTITFLTLRKVKIEVIKKQKD